MKSFLKYLAVLLSAFIILFFLFFLFLAGLTEREVIVEDNSYLHISLSGSLPDYRPDDPFEKLLGRTTLDLKKVRDVLEKAAVDERIEGVIIEPTLLQCGYAMAEEIQQYIKNYRKSGKKIYAYSEYAFMRDMLIASACDSVFMPANGNIFITGIGSEVVFYKDFFDKIGIGADFVHVGEYKDAPDSYTRGDMSETQRMVLNEILDSLYENSVQAFAINRNLSTETIKKHINETSGFTGREGFQAGIIDSNLFLRDVKSFISPGRLNKVSATDYAEIPASSLGIRDKSRIAVIHITGTIAPGSDVDDPLLGKLAGESTIVSDIRSAAASSTIKAIILRIDSPGGSAMSSNVIWDAVMRAKEEKPVVASIGDYGASGGYYVALAADTIINNSNSLVGSIGIFAGKFNIAGLYDKLGINPEIIQRGENASLFSTSRPWSQSERNVIQRLINDFYVDFVSKVAMGRDMNYESADALAGGRIWTGGQSFQNGMADSVGGFYSALRFAQVMAGIDEEESVRISYYPREQGLFTEFYGRVESLLNPSVAWQKPVSVLQQVQNKPMALIPYWIQWN